MCGWMTGSRLEATYPAQQADIDAAVRWLRHHAAALRIDPGRFAVLGESAGGQLAAIAGLTGTDETAIQAVIVWYGPAGLAGLPVEGARHVFAGAAVEVGTFTEAGADFLDDVLDNRAG